MDRLIIVYNILHQVHSIRGIICPHNINDIVLVMNTSDNVFFGKKNHTIIKLIKLQERTQSVKLNSSLQYNTCTINNK